MFRLLTTALLLTAAPLGADERLAPEVLAKVKAATVFVRVEAGPLGKTGSGFVIRKDGETALIATNEHVVAAPRLAGRPPLAVKVEVVFHPARKGEKTVAAEVLAADSERDLAILRVKNVKELPEPLATLASPDIEETVPVFMFGFPFGANLALDDGNPAVTVGRGAISSVRAGEFGEIKLIQIDGDINPGNSGGPVVDAKGRFVGVAVAKVRNSNIGFAVAPDEMARMLAGRIKNITVTTKAGPKGKVAALVRLDFIDPLAKVKLPKLSYRPSKPGEKFVLGKDGNHEHVGGGATVIDLKIDGQSAVGEFEVPASDPPKTFWLQPTYTDGDNKLRRPSPVTHLMATTADSSAAGSPRSSGPGKPLAGGVLKSIGDPVRIKADVGGAEPCACWSADAKSVFVLGFDGAVRKLAFPSLKEEAKLEAKAERGWLALSSLGLVLTHPGQQEIWLLDPATLKKKRAIETGPVSRTACAPASKFAFASCGELSRASLRVYDLEKGEMVKEVSPRDLPRTVPPTQLATPVISPDGKTLFAVGGLEQLIRFKVDGGSVVFAEASPRIVQGAFTGPVISPDGKYIAASSGGGNYGLAPGNEGFVSYSTYVFEAGDLSRPAVSLASGAYPVTIGYDFPSGAIYAQNFETALIVCDLKGLSRKQFALGIDRGQQVRQILVHPSGRKMVLIVGEPRPPGFPAEKGAGVFSVELPEKKE